MEASRFDQLTKSIAAAGTRRWLMRWLTALPAWGALAVLIDDESEAKDRRARRRERHRDRHQHRQRHRDRVRRRSKKAKKRKKKHHRCVPQPVAQTCAGRCAIVPDNCGQSVACGPCACTPPCPLCQTCDAATGRCVNRADGTACGPEQECVAGVCSCTTTSCAAGCCAGGACHIDDDDACGIDGGACIPCTGIGETCGGGGIDGACGCTSQGCGSQTCGSTIDNCGDSIPCTGCAGCCNGNSCLDGDTDAACGSSGDPCEPCSNPTPVCASNTCDTCSPLRPCPAGQCCAGGQCFATCPTGCCADGQCVPTCPECQTCDPAGDCVPVEENTLCHDDEYLCCGGQCLHVECCNSDFCGGEPCTPNGTCAVTCDADPQICDSSATCGCHPGFGGLGSQPICVDTAICICVTDCATCPMGSVCEDAPAGGSCSPTEHRCCDCCL